ncbi:MAG: Gfo/Idh/MocA family oxidoreductase [Anaerolineae bacterium]|nr:Gfo/Idh/MocA family oxidoreductase [Anaerolineae bacterium]MDH7473345.1 Gfo/Idh/MocA family oxidoreductase [Anaerolineae bacterium]
MHKITMLGTGLIGLFYTMTLNKRRGGDRVHVVYSPTEKHVQSFAQDWGIPKWTTNMAEAINDPETDVVVVGLPNFVHKEAVIMAAEAGKAVLCTKPLGRNAAEAKAMLDAVEKAGVFHGYLEDLVYTPKMLKSLQFVKNGALGRILWVRSRETHGGPHGAWFWDPQLAGGGAIVDMGCHCIEIARNFIGKDNRPVEVMCWADTLVHPIESEDHGIGLIRFESGAVGQFEVSWAFRGGMDLRDEVAGTEGTIWVDHFLRTGFEVFTAAGRKGYVSEKAEGETGWLFPVGDEVHELGYPHMFDDMLNALDSNQEPMETFYDGYVVNAIMDACYRSAQSKRWEPVELEVWRGKPQPVEKKAPVEYEGQYIVIKEEHMPDGKTKLLLKDKATNRIIEKVVSK